MRRILKNPTAKNEGQKKKKKKKKAEDKKTNKNKTESRKDKASSRRDGIPSFNLTLLSSHRQSPIAIRRF